MPATAVAARRWSFQTANPGGADGRALPGLSLFAETSVAWRVGDMPGHATAAAAVGAAIQTVKREKGLGGEGAGVGAGRARVSEWSDVRGGALSRPRRESWECESASLRAVDPDSRRRRACGVVFWLTKGRGEDIPGS